MWLVPLQSSIGYTYCKHRYYFWLVSDAVAVFQIQLSIMTIARHGGCRHYIVLL